ncbi:autotransporter domain-containing protein [Roseovarius arcticus]|uniref:autotransporter domain-containing protein n=1 Tax=Roseovarius arcticus TaxID=2547404 RepID=UPI0014860B32|nr:autotransporter domain-containing protein [Roseovarius arcticus]
MSLLTTTAILPAMAFWSNSAYAEGEFSDLGTLGGTYSYASAVSADGAVVVGNSNISGNSQSHAFRWANGTMADLGTLGGTYSYASAVSADGAVVVGSSAISGNSQSHAFRWANGTMADLGTLGGFYSDASAVSADGAVVVGNSNTSGNSQSHAFRWANGTMADLGTLGGSFSGARDVSADGTVIVGQSSISGNSEYHAFRWVGGLMSDLGTLGGTSSDARFVSADGAVVVGNSNTNGNAEYHAFRWANGTMADLGTLGGTYSNASAVSADGAVVVGNSNISGNAEYHAFRWANGTMADLGTLGGTYSYASAVSADGAVVVGSSANSGNSQSHAFRWAEITGMERVADWVVNEGGTVPTGYVLYEALGVSADGTVIIGYGSANGNQTAWLAKGNGFLSDTAAFDRSVVQAGRASVSTALEATDMAVHGGHHRSLMDMGFQVTPSGWFSWSTADAAENDYTDTTTALIETGFGRDIGNYRIGVAIGTTKSRQDWDLGGNAKFTGVYFLAEVDRAFDIAGGSTIQASLLGYYASFDTDLNRAYASGAGTDISSGRPDLKSAAIRAKVDWVKAATMGDVDVSPYAALTLSRAEVSAYTETGGAFPASYGESSADTGDLRIGAAFTTAPSDALNLRLGVEAVHQFEDGRHAVSGNVTDLYSFDLAGTKRESTWARMTFDADYALSKTSTLTGGLSGATQGSQPTVGVTVGLRFSI